MVAAHRRCRIVAHTGPPGERGALAASAILLSGYFGFHNLGDEAVLRGFLAWAHDAIPDHRCVVLSADPETTRALHGVEAIPRAPATTWQALARAEVLVSGGGSLLQDVTSWRTVPFYVGVMALARLRGVPVVWVGQGIGPVRRPWLRRLVRRAARQARWISVRDEASARQLAAWGVAPGQVHVGADLAWLLPLPEQSVAADPVPDQAAVAGATRPWRLAIAWRGGPAGGRGTVVPDARAIGAALADALPEGVRLGLVVMQPAQDLQPARELQDALLAAAAARRRPLDPPDVVVLPPDPVQAVAALREWDALVGARLHALILAGLAGVALAGVDRDPKIPALLESLEWPLRALPLPQATDPAAWKPLLRTLQAQGPLLSQKLRALRPELRHRAELGLEPLRALLAARLVPPACDERSVGVLGIDVSVTSVAQAARRGLEWATTAKGRMRRMVTLNPEMIMQALRDPVVQASIAEADLRVPDGIGVVWAARMLHGLIRVQRVPGIELVETLLELGAPQGLSVFLVGGLPAAGEQPGVADAAAAALVRRFPGLRIAGTHHGYWQPGSPEESALLQRIAAARPDLLLVGMGSPRQEIWVYRNRDRLDGSVGLAMGVGGSLDVWAGRRRRAPAWMRQMGLEWAWRVAREPARLGRAMALPEFAGRVLYVRWLDGRRAKRL